MYKIARKQVLNDNVTRMSIVAPLVASKGKPGQFIIFRVDEFGERIPLTIAGTNKEDGTVDIIFQTVGKATRMLSQKEEGEEILDFVGPLGKPSELEGAKRACVIGGGVGTAIAYPSAVALHEQGTKVDVIVGFRNKDIVILEEDFGKVADNLYMMTDDGSYGEHGFVTKKLEDLLEAGEEYDLVIAIGPVPMMKAVVDLTRPKGIRTLVSLNPIMVDGTGMCGGCRVLIGGKSKFACVDGPEFDGFEVDFEDLTRRNRSYVDEEKARDHACRMELAALELSSKKAE
ncbi:MAG TPA: sulfide/dihydroorotate dehydrogenase-like FAD/NAD-binding protein [Tissierellia bacterium]|jgi:ferredoxin--NADP+ reductase|nr:sulfide/dihydroorotate dehydrogenase-like FAD/NAD-binding protein [Tissierellia bacterium]